MCCNPFLAREIEPRRFQIIAGERRWRAAQAAG
ncbi:MAG: ParB N-terminal domain-containing protein, partial [Armatimonadota bacterium]